MLVVVFTFAFVLALDANAKVLVVAMVRTTWLGLASIHEGVGHSAAGVVLPSP